MCDPAIKEKFCLSDVSGNGTIPKEELFRVLKQLDQLSDDECEQLCSSAEGLSECDIQYEEWLDWVFQAVPTNEDASESFDVLQWNVLAAPFTKHNRAEKGCVQGHGNSGVQESLEQTRARYKLVTIQLLSELPDAALLQEVEPAFFQTGTNPWAMRLHRVYELESSGLGGTAPGTALLLRRKGRLRRATKYAVQCIGGAEETGGASKTAVLVPVIVVGASHSAKCGKAVREDVVVWLVSIHLTPPKYNPDKAACHLGLCDDALHAVQANGRCVLAGDFNALASELDDFLRERGCGRGLARVPLPDDAPTGLTADFAATEQIDHLLLGSGVGLHDAKGGRCVTVGGQPRSPYAPLAKGETGPAEVVWPSDHVWVKMQLRVLAKKF